MKPSRWYGYVGGTVLAVALLGAWVWHAGQPPAAASTEATVLGADERGAVSAVSSLAPLQRGALPSPEQPLAQAHPTLVRAALAGNERAIQQLVQALKRCRSLPSTQQTLGLQQLMLEPSSRMGAMLQRTPEATVRGGAIDQLRTVTQILKNKADDDVRYCADVSAPQLAELGPWLLRAAQAGDTQAALEYARGEHLQYDVLDQLDQVEQWRQQTPALLDQALQAGNAEALEILAHSFDPAPNEGNAPPQPLQDATRALAYYQLAVLTGQCRGDCATRIAQLRQQRGPIDAAAADDLAAQLCEQQFAQACDRR